MTSTFLERYFALIHADVLHTIPCYGNLCDFTHPMHTMGICVTSRIPCIHVVPTCIQPQGPRFLFCGDLFLSLSSPHTNLVPYCFSPSSLLPFSMISSLTLDTAIVIVTKSSLVHFGLSRINFTSARISFYALVLCC